MGRAEILRSDLVAYLRGRYAVRTPEWERAFRAVPRHAFVPRFLFESDPWASEPTYEEIDGTSPDQRDRWLELVYEDRSLLIPSEDGGRSSSSQPSIMAYMLEALEVNDGDSVLEVGLGSGYQAALLSERVGADHVTSIEIDPVVFENASRCLRSAGYAPHIAIADGRDGYPSRAPYDRLIASVYGWPLPQAWIRQVRPGGHLCVIAPSSLAMLTADDSGGASGPLHWTNFGFMGLRGHNPICPGHGDLIGLRDRHGDSRASTYPVTIVDAGGDQRSFWVMIGMLVHPYECMAWAGEGKSCWLDATDGSWAVLDYRQNRVTQGGPRRMWDEVELLYEQWCQLGAPNRERFGLTIEPDGRHVLWLDSADSTHRWDCHPSKVTA